MVVKVSISVPNDSRMITLSQSEAPIRFIMSGNAQWLCLLPPSSSIPPILVHLVVHLCRCRCSTRFPKEAGSLDAFRTGYLYEKHSVMVVRQPEIALFPSLHAPLCRKFFARLALALASSNRIASRQSQSRQDWKAPGAPDYATAIPSCLRCLQWPCDLTGVEMPALLSTAYPAIDAERCSRDMN